MLLNFKKILFTLIYNFSLFVILIIGIQNSSNKSKVNLILNNTVRLPLSFIIGISFIGGSTIGSFLKINPSSENE